MRTLLALAAAALLAAPTSAHAAVAEGVFHGQEQHHGCTYSGCGFSVTSDTCAGLTVTSTNGVMKCRVTVSGWVPDDSDSLYNGTAYVDDGRGTYYPPISLRYNGVSYVGFAMVGLDVVTISGTVTFSLPSGDLDPPPTIVTLTGSFTRA